jgi:glutamate dehydrogenase
VNRAGTSFVFRLGEETGATVPDIARAFTVVREVFDLRALWAEIEALDGLVAAKTQLTMLLKARILLERATRWLLRNQPRPLDVATAITYFGPGAAALAAAVPLLLPAGERDAAEQTAGGLVAEGVPPALASRVAHLEALVPALDLVEVAASTGLGFAEVTGVYFAIDDRLALNSLRARITALPREERWGALARRALWEDLQSEQRALTADVLRQSEHGSVADRVSVWIAENALPVERCLQVLADVKAGGASDLATLSVAVREIRNLIEATTARSRDAADRVKPPVFTA